MGLYDDSETPKLSIGWDKLAKPVAIVIAILVVGALFYFASQSLLQPKPLEIILSPNSNPWNPSIEKQASFQVKVSNITQQEALGYTLAVSPKASNVLQVLPSSYTRTDTLAVGDSRLEQFSFKALNPNVRPVAGNYTIDVSLEMNGQTFTKEFVLQILP